MTTLLLSSDEVCLQLPLSVFHADFYSWKELNFYSLKKF